MLLEADFCYRGSRWSGNRLYLKMFLTIVTFLNAMIYFYSIQLSDGFSAARQNSLRAFCWVWPLYADKGMLSWMRQTNKLTYIL